MTKDVDWHKLKQDYLFGSSESVSDFLREHGFKLNGYLTRKTFGWSDERKEFQSRLEEEIKEKTLSKVSETESEVRARQVGIAKKLQDKAMTALNKYEPRDAEEARRMLVDGLKEEREALGLNKRGQDVVVDINTHPAFKTRYGQAILTMSNEELIQVLQRINELDKSTPASSI